MHDIMVECAQLSLDLVDGSRGNIAAIADHPQHGKNSSIHSWSVH